MTEARLRHDSAELWLQVPAPAHPPSATRVRLKVRLMRHADPVGHFSVPLARSRRRAWSHMDGSARSLPLEGYECSWLMRWPPHDGGSGKRT